MTASPSPLEITLASLPPAPLIGVSGGIDSVALLHALVKTGRHPVVLHFDHGWRDESAQDAAWVRDLAKSLRLKFHSARMRSPGTKKREADARTARYAFFAQIARKLGNLDLVTAHHADDQVETFLLQLLRGAGASGHGMKPVLDRDGLKVHRPWLGLWRKEITAYARHHKLIWREDSTNADTHYRRNLIRRRILPYLQKQIGPAVTENLWRAAEILRAEGEWLDELTKKSVSGPELSVKTLQAAPLAHQRRTIRFWLQEHAIEDISFADIEAIRGLLENRIPAKINLSKGRFARRRTGKLFIE